MQYVYPCDMTGNEWDGDGVTAIFPDINGAITGGFTFREALINAEACLVVALAACVKQQEELPVPSPYQKGQELLTVQPVIAAQLDLYTAMREQNITLPQLAERLGISEPDAAPLLSLDYRTPIGKVIEAMRAVGCELAVAAAEPVTQIPDADREISSLDELMGSLPDLTGNLSTEEFIRMIRDDNAPE